MAVGNLGIRELRPGTFAPALALAEVALVLGPGGLAAVQEDAATLAVVEPLKPSAGVLDACATKLQ